MGNICFKASLLIHFMVRDGDLVMNECILPALFKDLDFKELDFIQFLNCVTKWNYLAFALTLTQYNNIWSQFNGNSIEIQSRCVVQCGTVRPLLVSLKTDAHTTRDAQRHCGEETQIR